MKIQYDKLADAMYVYLKKGKISKTIKMKDRLIVDVDKDGKIIGLEILGISSQMSKKDIGKIEMKMPVFAY
jgi:uncharacterized protein YuzE